MTWQTAKSTAEDYLRRLNLPSSLNGITIKLAGYESQDDLWFLKGRNEWPWEFHNMVNRSLARLMRKRGAVVEIVTLSMADYFSWLAKENLANTTANRAAFIAANTK